MEARSVFAVVLLLCAMLANAQLCELVLRDVAGSQDTPAVGYENLGRGDNVQLETSGTSDVGHFLATHANDGIYGNDSLVLAGIGGAIVGFDWKANDFSPFSIGGVAWSRDNTGAAEDLVNGLYEVEVARDPVSTDWTKVAEITYDATTDRPGLRHLYSIECPKGELADRVAAATGLRLRIPAGNIVDEVEVYTTDALEALDTGYPCGLFDVAPGGARGAIPFSVNRTGASFALNGTVDLLYDREEDEPTAVSVLFGSSEAPYMGAVFNEAIHNVSAVELTADSNLGSLFVQFTTRANASVSNDDDWVTIGRIANVGGAGLTARLHQLECGFELAFGPIWGFRLLLPADTPVSNIDFFGPPAVSVVGSVRNQLFGLNQPTPGGFIEVTGTDVPFGVFLSTLDGGVTFSPNPVTANLEGVSGERAEFLTTCSEVGPITVAFGTPSNKQLYGTSRALCVGAILVQEGLAPESVVRGNDFSIVIRLDPPAVEPIEFTVDVSNELVVPFHPRAYFGFDQSTTEVRFSAPLLNFVGDVDITFRAVRQRTYTPLTHTVRVLGTMEHSLAGAYADGVTTLETITLVPPTPLTTITDNANNVDNFVDVRVAINASSVGQVFPETLEYITGQASASFEFTPLVLGDHEVVFTSAYYVPLSVPIQVSGGFFSSAPDQIVVGQSLSFRLSVKPAPVGELIVTAVTDGDISFPDGSSQLEIVYTPVALTRVVTIAALGSSGKGSITFSAPGFSTHADTLDVLETPECADGFLLAADGQTCAPCPRGTDAAVCSGSGVCIQSVVAAEVTCGCTGDAFGSACELADVSDRLQDSLFVFPLADTTFHAVIGFIKTVSILDITANGGSLLQLGANGLADDATGLFVVDAEPTTPAASLPLPVEAGFHFERFSGAYPFEFVLEVLYEDSTPVAAPFHPVGLGFKFNRNGDLPDADFVSVSFFGEKSLIQPTSHDINRMRLYRWSNGAWVHAASECGASDQSVASRVTYDTTVCWPGHYALFVRDNVPEPPTKGAAEPIIANPVPLGPAHPDVLNGNVHTTTGSTGIQAPMPVDPMFQEEAADGEVQRTPVVGDAARSAASLVATLLGVGVAFVFVF